MKNILVFFFLWIPILSYTQIQTEVEGDIEVDGSIYRTGLNQADLLPYSYGKFEYTPNEGSTTTGTNNYLFISNILSTGQLEEVTIYFAEPVVDDLIIIITPTLGKVVIAANILDNRLLSQANYEKISNYEIRINTYEPDGTKLIGDFSFVAYKK